MKNILSTLALSALVSVGSNALISESAFAACIGPGNCTITLDGTDYEISISTRDSYLVLETELTSQPWWNNEVLAESAATQVGLQLGKPNDDLEFSVFPVSPLFAWNFIEDPVELDLVQVFFNDDINTAVNYEVTDGSQRVWAIATEVTEAVPEPVTILGTLMAGGIGVAMKKKRGQN